MNDDMGPMESKGLLDHLVDLRPGPLFVHHRLLARNAHVQVEFWVNVKSGIFDALSEHERTRSY